MQEYVTTINHNYTLKVKAPVKVAVVAGLSYIFLAGARRQINTQLERFAEKITQMENKKKFEGGDSE